MDEALIADTTDLSPYILCRFLLGLAPGVLSLIRPASSISFRALLSAVGSTGSDPALSVPFLPLPLARLRLIAAGGVLLSGGTSVGVCAFSILTVGSGVGNESTAIDSECMRRSECMRVLTGQS